MEKITSNNTALSSNFIFADISKNMSQRADIKTDVSFKDYVRSNSNENNKFENKRDFKKSAKSEINEKDKTEVDDKSFKNNSVKKDSVKKDEVSGSDNKTKNTSDEKTQSKKDEKVENTEQKDPSVSDKNQNLNDTKQENLTSEENIDTNAYMLNMAMIQNDVNQAQVQEDTDLLFDVSKENDAQLVKAKDISLENTALNDLQNDVKQKVKSENTDMIELDDEFSALDVKKETDVVRTFKEVVKDVTDKKDNQRDNLNIENDVTKIDIKREISLLKEDAKIVINNQINEILNTNNDLDIDNPINISIDATGMRNFVISNKISTHTIGKSTFANEQIQNFAKVVDEMRVAFRGNKTTFDIKLEPESLGKLSVRINSENGVFNASFYVDSQKAKQAIENDLHILRQSLLEQGVNIQEINVQVGQNNQESNYHQNIMEAMNFSKKGGVRLSVDELEFDEVINPYMVSDDMFNDLY